MSEATIKQALPHGTGPAIHILVINDLEQRVAMGKIKYGEVLRACNGRDALTDAYQEALDLCLYLKQELVERSRV